MSYYLRDSLSSLGGLNKITMETSIENEITVTHVDDDDIDLVTRTVEIDGAEDSSNRIDRDATTEEGRIVPATEDNKVEDDEKDSEDSDKDDEGESSGEDESIEDNDTDQDDKGSTSEEETGDEVDHEKDEVLAAEELNIKLEDAEIPLQMSLYSRINYLEKKEDDRYFGSMEALNFQVNSPLVKALDDFFADCFTRAEEITPTAQWSVFGIEKRIEKLSKYVKENLPKIIEKHTNLKIAKYYATEMKDNQGKYLPTFSFFTTLDFVDPNSLYQQLGYGSVEVEKHRDRKAEKEYKELSQIWSADTPMLRNVVTGELKGKPLEVGLGFDTVGAFFLKHYNTASQTREGFTPGELTAIVLHEIGHTNSLIERACESIYLAKRYTDEVEVAKKTKDVDSLVTKFTDWKLKAKNLKDKDTTNLILRVDEAKERLDNLKDQSESGVILGTLQIISAILIPFLSLCAGVFIRVTFLMQFLSLCGNLYLIVQKNSAYKGSVKKGDVAGSFGNDTLMERWADEFVSRLGKGGDLASGLRKISLASSTFLPINSYNRWYTSKLTYWLFQMDFFIISTFFTIVGPPSTYDFITVRMRKVKEDVSAMFKNADLPADVKDYYLIQTKKAIDEYEKVMNKYSGFGKTFLKYLLAILSLDIGALAGKFSESFDFNKFFDNVKSLDDNGLYYYSELLDKLRK